MSVSRHNEHRGLRSWWMSPPRHGMRLIIAPWEYRHLRGFARLRGASGITLIALGIVTLCFGGNDWKTYVWALAFGVAGGANLVFGYWELTIARSLRLTPGQLASRNEPQDGAAAG